VEHNDEQFPNSRKNKHFILYRNPVTVSGSAVTMPFSSGPIHHSDLAPTANPPDYSHSDLQRFLRLRPIPVPDLIQDGLSAVHFSPAIEWWGFDQRMAYSTGRPIAIPGAANARTTMDSGVFIRADSGSAQSPGAWISDHYHDPLLPGSLDAPRSDVVRTLIAKDGDNRLVACKPSSVVQGLATDDV